MMRLRIIDELEKFQSILELLEAAEYLDPEPWEYIKIEIDKDKWNALEVDK